MSAGPYLWQRLRRWWALQCLQVRHQQLQQCIAALEAGMQADQDVLAALRMERSSVSMRLRHAQTVHGAHRRAALANQARSKPSQGPRP